MNAINRVVGSIFDTLLIPFELLGSEGAIVLVSCLFTTVMLLAFKRFSSQKGIKGVKDRIKGNMIAIRIYQDDLAVVGKAVAAVVLRNFQYLALNFAPFIPLSIPFVLVAAQLVVRYGFDPIPIEAQEARADDGRARSTMAGRGTLIEVTLKDADKSKVASLEFGLPPELKAVSPLHRSVLDGTASLEVVAVGDGVGEIEILIDGRRVGAKQVATGESRPRVMQPERVASPLLALLWPAEDTYGSDSPIARVVCPYPDRELRWMMDGPGGVFVTFVLISFAFGLALIKPLKIQI